MHIPQSSTDLLALEPFDPALEAALSPSADFVELSRLMDLK